jgi:thiol-disulfide isomerase/thioredoxin
MVSRFYTALYWICRRHAAWTALLLGALAAAGAGAVGGAEQRTVALAEADLPVQVFVADGARLVLWLPPEEGPSPRQLPTARALADAGIEVWMPDLHAAWFLPPGGHSLADVPPESLAVLVDAATATGKQVFLVAGGRTGQLALGTARAWQQRPDRQGRLGGVVLLYPKLYGRTPQGGEDARFAPIVHATNVPTFVMQPEKSSGWWRVADVAAALHAGGAAVYVQKLPGVSDAFEVRNKTRAGELEMTDRLPAMLENALALLEASGPAPATAAALADQTSAARREPGSELLRAVSEPFPAPALALPALDDRSIDLESLRGTVVLVNFWATWCPPCVQEIPSLDRLRGRLAPRGFEVLAVDVGETADQAKAFLRERPVTFRVLIDADGESFKRWKAYAFPTSLLLDRQHRVRYAVYGALAWDDPEVIEVIERLLQEP